MKTSIKHNLITLLLVTAIFLSALPFAYLKADTTGSLSLSPENGVVGTTVTITGSGFTPDTSYRLYFSSDELGAGDKISEGDSDAYLYFGLINTPPGSDELTRVEEVPTEMGDGETPVQPGIYYFYIADNESMQINAAAEFEVRSLPPTLSIDPESGALGDTVTISGNEFPADEDVALTVEGNEIGTAAADSSGNFSKDIDVWEAPGGTYTIIATSGACEASAEFEIINSVSISVMEGKIGDTVDITGSGLAGDTNFYVRFGGSHVQNINPSKTDEKGNIDSSFQVPVRQLGTNKLEIRVGNLIVFEEDFEVYAEVFFYPLEGPIGTEVTIEGEVFSPNEDLTLQWDGKSINDFEQKTNEQGQLPSINFVVPAEPAGEYEISISDGTVTKSAFFEITTASIPSPELISPGHKTRAGDPASFEWQAVEHAADITYEFQLSLDADFDTLLLESDDIEQTQYVFDSDIDLDPATPANPYFWRVRALDEAGNVGEWSDTFEFYYSRGQTIINNEKDFYLVGEEIEINGFDYLPGENISVELNGTDVTGDVDGRTEADNNGNFILYVTIPELIFSAEPHHISVSGEDSLTGAEFDITVIPNITLDRESAQAGEVVTIKGFSFANRLIVFGLGGTEVPVQWVVTESKRADTSGFFEVEMIIPDLGPGEYTLTATDNSNSAISARHAFTIEEPPLDPAIEVDPTSGKVSDEFTVSGTEFLEGEQLTITIGDIELGTVEIGSDNAFPETYNVPEMPGGDYEIKAYYEDGLLASSDFTIEQYISLDAHEGRIGSEVTVNGNGLPAEAEVIIKFGEAEIDPEQDTGQEGSLEFNFQVPAVPPDEHLVVVSIGGKEVLEEWFITTAEVMIEPAEGPAGTEIDLKGEGFTPGEQITVHFGEKSITGSDIIAESNGNFSSSFKAPQKNEGDYIVNISDGAVTLSKSFQLIASEPDAPQPIKPGPGDFVQEPITLKWSSVGHTLPVNYELRISKDPSFSQLLIDETGLMDETFTISSNPVLNTQAGVETSYFWQVRAIDSSGNPGSWSRISEFIISPDQGPAWPSWLIWMFMLGVSILITLSTLLIGLRLSR